MTATQATIPFSLGYGTNGFTDHPLPVALELLADCLVGHVDVGGEAVAAGVRRAEGCALDGSDGVALEAGRRLGVAFDLRGGRIGLAMNRLPANTKIEDVSPDALFDYSSVAAGGPAGPGWS